MVVAPVQLLALPAAVYSQLAARTPEQWADSSMCRTLTARWVAAAIRLSGILTTTQALIKVVQLCLRLVGLHGYLIVEVIVGVPIDCVAREATPPLAAAHVQDRRDE